MGERSDILFFGDVKEGVNQKAMNPSAAKKNNALQGDFLMYHTRSSVR
ncbi:hypothetical protein VII00023_00560 [Vibrio ichthyoenteri ATCC 700023]|uniref:Uncharacterized protein n=1 Tax=Vibrio ichthyoenteri ATCC 700023 TaxID=870968 RepID=F9S7Y1_9VIBR|nr:hypothetical protein VII00023_00560 [Vibrio ichthyoenteri ATCC 700023]